MEVTEMRSKSQLSSNPLAETREDLEYDERAGPYPRESSPAMRNHEGFMLALHTGY